MRRVSVFLILVGCGGADTNTTDDTANAYAAALTVDSAVQESGIVATIAGELTAQSSTGTAAANDAATITSQFMPSGCATSTVIGNVVSYKFAKCTGPYGLLRLDGTLTATFTPAGASMIKVDLAATGFAISSVSADVTASAIITVGVTQNSATVTSTSSATNARGDTAVHSGSYTAGWDSSCLTLDGTFMTTIGGASWSTTVSNFRQCNGMCPDSGGTVVITSASGDVVTVHYTNGGSAEVTTSGSTRGMILLSCGAV